MKEIAHIDYESFSKIFKKYGYYITPRARLVRRLRLPWKDDIMAGKFEHAENGLREKDLVVLDINEYNNLRALATELESLPQWEYKINLRYMQVIDPSGKTKEELLIDSLPHNDTVRKAIQDWLVEDDKIQEST